VHQFWSCAIVHHFTAKEIIQNHKFTRFYGDCIKMAVMHAVEKSMQETGIVQKTTIIHLLNGERLMEVDDDAITCYICFRCWEFEWKIREYKRLVLASIWCSVPLAPDEHAIFILERCYYYAHENVIIIGNKWNVYCT